MWSKLIDMKVYYFFHLPQLPDTISLILGIGVIVFILWYFIWVILNNKNKDIVVKYQRRLSILFWLFCIIPIKLISDVLVQDFKNDHTLLTILGWFLCLFGWLLPYTIFSIYNKLKFK